MVDQIRDTLRKAPNKAEFIAKLRSAVTQARTLRQQHGNATQDMKRGTETAHVANGIPVSSFGTKDIVLLSNMSSLKGVNGLSNVQRSNEHVLSNVNNQQLSNTPITNHGLSNVQRSTEHVGSNVNNQQLIDNPLTNQQRASMVLQDVAIDQQKTRTRRHNHPHQVSATIQKKISDVKKNNTR